MPSRKTRRSPLSQARQGPSSDDAHAVVYFKRHPDDDPAETEPRFSGGGAWEAMHGDMTGWFEVRRDGPRRHHDRLFCLLDYDAEGQDKPLLVVIDGRDKPFRKELTDADYDAVRTLGEEYLKRNPRSIC